MSRRFLDILHHSNCDLHLCIPPRQPASNNTALWFRSYSFLIKKMPVDLTLAIKITPTFTSWRPLIRVCIALSACKNVLKTRLLLWIAFPIPWWLVANRIFFLLTLKPPRWSTSRSPTETQSACQASTRISRVWKSPLISTPMQTSQLATSTTQPEP